jgi:hypothetical protein
MEKLSLPKRKLPNQLEVTIQPIQKLKWYENEDFVLGLSVGVLATIGSILVFFIIFGLLGIIFG